MSTIQGENIDLDLDLDLEHLEVDRLDLDNAFWKFSLNQWENSELQKTLLMLQDKKGFRVNILLFSLWLSTENKRIDGRLEDIYKLTQAWHEMIVSPLRTVRKNLPATFKNSELKTQVQRSEIQAEQIEQALLFHFSASIPTFECSEIPLLDLLSSNLMASKIPHSDLLLLRHTYLSSLRD